MAMEPHHDGARRTVRPVAFALPGHGEFQDTVAVVIAIADVEGRRRCLPGVSGYTALRHLVARENRQIRLAAGAEIQVAVAEPCVALIHNAHAAGAQRRGVVEAAGALSARLVNFAVAVVIGAVTHLRRTDDAGASDLIEQEPGGGRSIEPFSTRRISEQVPGSGDIVRRGGAKDAEHRLSAGPLQDRLGAAGVKHHGEADTIGGRRKAHGRADQTGNETHPSSGHRYCLSSHETHAEKIPRCSGSVNPA